jgi:hypothetical protein
MEPVTSPHAPGLATFWGRNSIRIEEQGEGKAKREVMGKWNEKKEDKR